MNHVDAHLSLNCVDVKCQLQVGDHLGYRSVSPESQEVSRSYFCEGDGDAFFFIAFVNSLTEKYVNSLTEKYIAFVNSQAQESCEYILQRY